METLIKVKIDASGKVSGLSVVGSGVMTAGGMPSAAGGQNETVNLLRSIDRRLGGTGVGRGGTGPGPATGGGLSGMAGSVLSTLRGYAAPLAAGSLLYRGIGQTFQTRTQALEHVAGLAGYQAQMGTPMPKEIQDQLFIQFREQQRRAAIERYDLQIKYGGPIDTATGWIGKQWETHIMPGYDRLRGGTGIFGDRQAQMQEIEMSNRKKQVQISGQRLENNTLGR